MSANPLEGFEVVEFNGGIRPVSDPDAVLRKVFPGIASNSTYRPPNHPLSQKNPTSYHTTTHGAIDVSPIPGVSFEAYLQAYKNQGYHIIEARDEVKNPSKNATGPHWHVVLGLPNTEDAPAPGPDDFNFDRDYEIIEAKDDIVVKGKGIPAPKDIPVPVTQTENVAQFVDSPSEVQPMDPEVEKQYLQMVYDPSIPYEDVQRFAQRYGKNPDFESFNEIRKYIADNPDTFKVVPPNYINAPYAADVPTDGATGATIRGVANGVVANLLEEFGAAADTLIGTPGRPSVWNSDKRLADLYQENLFRNQDITGYDREAHPVASYGGEFGGGIVGFGKAKNLADLAMIGSAYGAVVGFGEQGAFTDRLTNAGIGSVTGGVASVALGAAVMAAAKRLGKPLDQVLPEEVIADDVDQVAPDIAAALKEDPLSIDKALESAPPSLKARLKSGVSQESVAAGQQPIPPKRNSVGEITKTVSKITSEWKNTPEFNIVQNVDELPKAVRGALRRNNAREVFGFVDPEGKVTIIGDNIKDPDMIPAIVFHESLGHLGLRNKFGKDLDSFLENLYKTNHDIRNRTKTWLESRSNTALYRNSPAPLARAVEEQLAMMSEEGVISPSLMDRIVAWFRAFGRKHGMSLRYTDGEVRNILALAHKTITDGTNANETVDGLRFIYAGRGSKTADVNAYENAVSAREMGVDSETVRKRTGWFLAPDRRWRYEISDHDASLAMDKLDQLAVKSSSIFDEPRSLPLEQIFHHPELFKAYPQLRDTKVISKSSLWDFFGQEQGSFDPKTGTINITPHAEDKLGTLLHEVQHAVQQLEGFAKGGNTEQALNAMSSEKLKEMADIIVKYNAQLEKQLRTKLDAYQWAEKQPEMAEYVKAHKIVQGYTNEYSFNELRALRESEDPVDKLLYEEYRTALTTKTKARRKLLQKLGFDSDQVLSSDDEDKWFRMLYDFRTKGIDEVRQKTLDGIFSLQEQTSRLQHATSKEGLIKELKKNEQLTFEAYEHLFGEVEARDTANRLDMSTIERRLKEPYTSDEHIDPDNYLFQYMSPQEMKSRGKAGNINLDNMETTEDIDNILKQYAQEVVPDPSRSLDETEALARLLGMTKSKLVKLRPNFTDVELTAARQVLVDHAEVLSRLGDAAYGPGPERGSWARIERFQKAVIAHKAIQEKVMNLVGQAGRTLNAAKVKVGTEEGRAISRALREADLGQLDNPEFLEILAKNIWAASNDPGAVGTVVDQALKPLPEDYFISGRQSLMLSGHKTHIKNIMGNIVSIFQDNAEQIVASGLGQFRRGKTNDRVFFRGAIMRPAMMLQTLFEGAHWSRVSQSWRESHPYHQVSKYENGRLIFEGAAAPLQIPYRALATEDAMFRSMIENANFYEQAVRRVADTNPQTWAEWADRVDELRKNPTPEMIKESDLHTSVLQLIDDPTILGKSINILKSRPNDPKTVKGYAQRLVRFLAYQLLPFHSVADRIFMHNVRRIPIVGLLDRVNLEDIAAGGARRDLAIARQIMGIAYIGAIWELGSLAADLINGSEDNYRKAKQEEGENRLPQSFRVGDQWISYAGLDQLGISLTAISDLRKKYDRGELSEEDAISNAINMMPAITKAMKESTFMEQLGEFFEALGSDPLSKNARENWIAGYVSSFVPGIVRQTNQTFVDDKVRDSTGDGTAWGKIKGRVKSGIPGLSDDLPQKYDVYGRPLDRKGQSTIGVGDSKPVENNPTIKEIARLSLEANENKAVVTPADRRSVEAIVGKNADASVVQEFQKRSGEFLLQNLTDLMATDEYQNADDPTKLKMVKKTVERSRKEIREQMVEESFDFDSEFEVVE